jgi:hypothetical protein
MVMRLRSAANRVATLRRDAGQDDAARRLLARLGEPGGLADVAAELGELEDHEVEYLAAFPPRLIEGVRAALFDAANSDAPPLVDVQFLPGYDFEVRLLEWDGNLTIHCRGPFSGAAFPRESFRSRSKR